jgi:hypothetical protein
MPYVQFPSGLLFPDVVEVNFSLTVDPLAMRGPGLNTVNTSLQVINIFHCKNVPGCITLIGFLE